MRAYFIVGGLALVLSLGLLACNKGGGQQQAATNSASAEALDGAAIYAKANCAMCHGVDRTGKPVGPALLTLKQNWTLGKLEEYLTDPQGFSDSDSRLSEQRQQYTMKMPAPNISQEERHKLAQWLLGE